MPGRPPPAVPVSPDERQQLERLIASGKTPQQLALRARIVLALATGLNAPEVAHRLNSTRTTVRLWRRCWLERDAAPVLDRLSDGERSGAPPTFTPEQWCQITALACEAPSLSNRPISHWTPRELVDEAIKRGIVETISERHLARFLKGGGPQASFERLLAPLSAQP